MGTKQFDSATDLITFSRASSGTLMDSDGLVKRAGHNLLSYSEQFDNADWTKTDVSIEQNVSGVLAPDGTETAGKQTDNAQNNRHDTQQVVSLSANTVATASVFVKQASGGRYCNLNMIADLNVNQYISMTIDLEDGLVTQHSVGSDATSVAYGVVSVGNGWYRAYVTGSFNDNDYFIKVQNSPSATPAISDYGNVIYTGDGTNSFYLWGAHLYRSDLPMVPNRNQSWTAETTYYPTTSAAYESPRIEYSADGTVKGLLIEEQRTNLITYSEDFTDASWIKNNSTVTKKTGITAPDGSENVYHLQEDTATSQHRINPGITAGTQVLSVYAKGDGSGRYLKLYGYGLGGANESPIFDVDNGILYEPPTQTHFLSASIQDVGNGWYRCSLEADTDGGSGEPQITLVNATNLHGVESYTGDGTSGVYIYGAQIEAGSFPTSYIPTSGATATRSADIASIPVSNIPYNQNAITIHMQGTMAYRDTNDNSSFEFYRWRYTPNDGVLAWLDSDRGTGGVTVLQDSGSSTTIESDGSVFSEGDAVSFSLATTHTKSGLSVCVNGGSIVSGSLSGNFIDATQDFNITNDSNISFNGHISSLKIYPRELSETQLQEITS